MSRLLDGILGKVSLGGNCGEIWLGGVVGVGNMGG